MLGALLMLGVRFDLYWLGLILYFYINILCFINIKVGLIYYIAHKAIMIRNDEVIIKQWIYFLSGLKALACVGAFGSSGFTLILNLSV